MNPNVSNWNTPLNTGNTVTLTMAGGAQRQFTGSQALSIINYLSQNESFLPITNSTTHVTEYIMFSKDCGGCVAATVTPTSEAGTPVPCEEGLPGCAGNPLNPTTPVIKITNAVVFVPVGGDITLTTDVNVANPVIAWASEDEDTATVDNTGKVTGVKVGTTTVSATLATGQKATATINVIAAV